MGSNIISRSLAITSTVKIVTKLLSFILIKIDVHEYPPLRWGRYAKKGIGYSIRGLISISPSYTAKLLGAQFQRKEQPITSRSAQSNSHYPERVVSEFLGRGGSSGSYVWENEGLGNLSTEILLRPLTLGLGDTPSAESEAADTTLANDRIEVHPDYNTDDPGKAPDIWKHSDRVRVLIERKGDPNVMERYELASAVVRQLRTVVLYWQVLAFFQAVAKNTNPSKTMSLYVVLFPGEAKDNTGIKDLNDKVLGYQLNAKYIQRRQQELSKLFWRPGDKFLLVGQDYKTAYILTLEATRGDFAKRLAELDTKLREILLNEILPDAEKDAKKRGEKERLAEIQKLRRTLEKNKQYRFDIFFGLSTVEPRGSITNAIDVVFLLVTEALKGAGIAKFIAKGMSLKTKVARGFVKGIEADGRALDARGKAYQPNTYLTASMKAGDIKALMTKKPSRDNPADYYSIYVDTVWTVSFIKYRRWYIGNPHVIRDVRKKALEPPRMRDGNIKYTFEAQKEMLELWLVVLNMLDFVKDFLTGEFRNELVRYHDDALAVFSQLRRRPFAKIDWPKLERVLTRDLRQTQRIAVLGTASEFQFYSFAADYSERIFFSMDIRDLGVALMLLYENANEEIEDKKPTGVKLMEETFRSSDPINEQRRFTYDRVVDTFRRYYFLLGKSAAVKVAGEARKAFGTGMRTTGGIPEFSKCVQVLLGGDEVFVAAHPYFEPYVHKIISDLDETTLKVGTLNMRTAVAYSKAEGDRAQTQASHHQAMTLADQAPNTLKQLERTHRRIERLIEKLEANPKKKDLAPQYRKELENLRLFKLFARVNHGKPKVLTAPQLNRLLRLFKAGNIRAAEGKGSFELVDFNGNVVNGEKLRKDAANLEEMVRRKVGLDNTHVDPPPVTKLPKWLEKLLDAILK